MHVTFEWRREIAPGIWEYSFLPARPIDFVPGQYVDLFLEHVIHDPRGASRTFSTTTLPSDSSLRFITKHFGLQTPYKHVLRHLEPGTAARIGDAMGDLVLPKSPSTPLVFVAGGIGIASYVSMFRDLIARKDERPIYLFYALRSHREQLFSELFNAYPLQLKDIVIRPNRLSAQQIKESTPPQAIIYLSGDQGLVEGLRKDLEALGTSRSSIVFDYYDGYVEL